MIGTGRTFFLVLCKRWGGTGGTSSGPLGALGDSRRGKKGEESADLGALLAPMTADMSALSPPSTNLVLVIGRAGRTGRMAYERVGVIVRSLRGCRGAGESTLLVRGE